MPSNQVRRIAIRLGVLLLFLLASGCGGKSRVDSAVKTVSATFSTRADRAVVRKQSLRERAVSRSVGRWAVVVGISDYRFDTRANPAKGIPDLKYANNDGTVKSQAAILM